VCIEHGKIISEEIVSKAENELYNFKPFDPSSKQLIEIQDKNGKITTKPLCEWLLDIKTNGRGGT
jgi:F420-0:gamma-glutamyl ligase